MKGPTHEFSCRLVWTGAEAGATTFYRDYSRALSASFEGKPALALSAAGAFRGEPTVHNPEDLLVASLSACHCLSYLALCACRGVHVVGYADDAWGRMALVDGGLRFVEVVLRPTVTLAPGADRDEAQRLHGQAHEECFIARSVAFGVRHEPRLADP